MKRKIGIIAPPFTSIPPKGQGGTERIVYQLAEGLKKKGYKVTVFGAGKCKVSCNFVPILKKTISERKLNPFSIESSRSLRLETTYLALVMEELKKRSKEFDIIFNHARGGYLFIPLAQYLKIPLITILHLPLFKELENFLSKFKNPNIITISNSQRKGFPKIKYLATIYNGVDLKEFPFCKKPKDYFLFMGAIGEHKNPKDAILAAKKSKIKLIIAGGKKREPYFSKEIKPLIDNKQIKYVGEVAGKERINLFKYAKGFLFPIRWEEPFGLVMIEAMACGTPVIAYPRGGAKEVVKNGTTGFLVKNVNEMVKAIRKINNISREACRERVKKYFSLEKMLENYEKIIEKFTK